MTQRTIRWFVRGLLAGGLALAGTVSALAAGGLLQVLSDAGPQVEETPIVIEPTPAGTEEPDGENNDGATDDLDDGQADDIDDGAVEDLDEGDVNDIDDDAVEDVDEAGVEDHHDGYAEDHGDGESDDHDDESGAVKFFTIAISMTPTGWEL